MTESSLPIIIIGAGQSGLAAASSAAAQGLQPLVLEAGSSVSGSWPDYYDSLRLFSPARYSALPGLPFPGDPHRYPHRDEVVAYLQSYTERLDAEIRTGVTVTRVTPADGGFTVSTAGGEQLRASAVVAATGSFGNPHRPALPGAESFQGPLLHVADYRDPAAYAGNRVVVVGAGNSAVQVAHELAERSTVTLARRRAPEFVPQMIDGHDVHYWFATTGFDHIPGSWLALFGGPPLVLDAGGYRAAYDAGRLHQRPMFTSIEEDEVVWPDGTRDRADAIILATGYRPNLGYLSDMGALDPRGLPRQFGGISTTHPGLVYLGLEGQRSFASNTLRGVSRDADYVIAAVAPFATGALAALGLSG